MNKTFSFLLVLFPVLLFAQNTPEYTALDDPAFIEDVSVQGLYGQYLELQGENNKALEYYRSHMQTAHEAKERVSLLEWYLGFSEAPHYSDTNSLKNLILQYFLTGDDSKLVSIQTQYPLSFELNAIKNKTLFLLPYLFTKSEIITGNLPQQPDTSPYNEENTHTRNGIEWTYSQPPESVNVPDNEAGIKAESEAYDTEVQIQLGSFRYKKNALEHLELLASKGIDARVKEKYNGEQLFYITVIPAGDDIQTTLLRLKEKGQEGFPLYP